MIAQITRTLRPPWMMIAGPSYALIAMSHAAVDLRDGRHMVRCRAPSLGRLYVLRFGDQKIPQPPFQALLDLPDPFAADPIDLADLL